MTQVGIQPRATLDADRQPRVAGPVWLLRALELAIAVVLAAVVFAQFDNPTQHIDELYHVLAAKSLLNDGDLLIGETGKPYTRSRGFTYAVAASFEVFGVGIWQSRLPSMLAGLVLIGIVFGWARRRFGRLSAWLWVGLMLLCPLVVFASEFSRFYMVQAAAVAGMLVGADLALDPALGRVRRCLAGALVLLSTAVAMHMQESSLFAVAAVFGGVLCCLLWRLGERYDKPAGWRFVVIGGVLLAGLLAVGAGLLWVEPVQAKWAKYTGAVAWAVGSRDDASYYLSYLQRWHKWPLVLSPFMAVLACWRFGWRGAWVVALFALGFVGHSFGGMKAPRYLLWALPYFWLTLAIGVGASPGLVVADAYREERLRRIMLGIGVGAAESLLLVFAVARTSGFYQVKTMVTGGYHAFQYSDWPGVLAALEQDSAWSGGVVVASVDTKAMDALARCDYSLSTSRAEGRDEFEPDWRTGLPVISRADSVAAVIARHPAGVIVIETPHWRVGWAVPDEAADAIEALAQPVVVDPALRLMVFRWDRRDATPAGEATP